MKHEQSALVKGDYDKRPREAKKTADSKFTRIWKYYHNQKTRVELTPEEEAIRQRLEKAWFLLCSHRTRKQVAELLVRIFNISIRQGWQDVADAMNLFSNPQEEGLKEAKRAIAETNAMRGMQRCWKNGDMEGYLKFQQEYNKINDLYTPREEDSLAKFLKNFKPHTIIINTSADALLDQAKGLAKQFENGTVDIPHDEIE